MFDLLASQSQPEKMNIMCYCWEVNRQSFITVICYHKAEVLICSNSCAMDFGSLAKDVTLVQNTMNIDTSNGNVPLPVIRLVCFMSHCTAHGL